MARALTANGEDAEATCATTGWLSFLFGIFAPGGGRADLDPVWSRLCQYVITHMHGWMNGCLHVSRMFLSGSCG